MRDLPSHWLAELWQDATCPEGQKSPSTTLQHQVPAPHTQHRRERPAERHTAHWLFTAWVQLLVSALSTGREGLLGASRLLLQLEVLPSEPGHHMT